MSQVQANNRELYITNLIPSNKRIKTPCRSYLLNLFESGFIQIKHYTIKTVYYLIVNICVVRDIRQAQLWIAKLPSLVFVSNTTMYCNCTILKCYRRIILQFDKSVQYSAPHALYTNN